MRHTGSKSAVSSSRDIPEEAGRSVKLRWWLLAIMIGWLISGVSLWVWLAILGCGWFVTDAVEGKYRRG